MNKSNKIIQSANIQEKGNLYFFPKHIHQNIEIYYFIEGSSKMDIGREKIIAETGNIIMILPNTVHSVYLDKNMYCKFIHIHFDPNKISSFFTNNINLDILSIFSSINHYYKFVSNKNTTSLLYSIINEFKNPDQFSETLCNLYLLELLIYFIKKEKLLSLLLISESVNTPSYVLLALEYIKEKHSEKILIPDIANYLNISSRYLSKLFYEYTNLTVVQYINIYRINKAIDLMISSDSSLTEISLNVGLGDIQHFSKLFKNIMGIVPSQYKKLLLKT